MVGGEAKQYLLGNIKHFTEKDLLRPVLQPFSHASHCINPRDAAHMSEATRVRAVLAHSSTSKGYGMSCTVMILFHFLPPPLIYWETPRKSLNLSKTKFTQVQEHSKPPTILVKCSEVPGGKLYLQIISVSAFMEINLSFCVQAYVPAASQSHICVKVIIHHNVLGFHTTNLQENSLKEQLTQLEPAP